MSKIIWRAIRPFIEEQRDQCRKLAKEFPDFRHALIIFPEFKGNDVAFHEADLIVANGLRKMIAGDTSLHDITFRSCAGDERRIFGIRTGEDARSIFFGRREGFDSFVRLSFRIIEALKTRPKDEYILPDRMYRRGIDAKAHIWATTALGVLQHFVAASMRPDELRFALIDKQLLLEGYPPRPINDEVAAEVPILESIRTGNVFARMIKRSAFEISAKALDAILGGKIAMAPQSRRRKRRFTNEDKAIAIYFRDTTISLPELAKKVGCHPKAIYKMDELRRLIEDEERKQFREIFRTGYKNSDGSFQAWEKPSKEIN